MSLAEQKINDFEITCKKCGSLNVGIYTVSKSIRSSINDLYIKCEDCKNTNNVYSHHYGIDY